MTMMPPVVGVTFTLKSGPANAAVAFYTELLGRAPDYSPHEDFHEWELRPDAWLQLSTDADPVSPSSFRVRFQVHDLNAAVRLLRDRGVAVDEPATLPGVVAFTNFADPWGNPLGFFQDVSTTDGAPVPGGRSGDASLFRSGVVSSDSA